MSIKLPGATNGSIELDVPASCGSDLSVTIPAIAGEILVADASGDVETSATGTGGSSGSALIAGYQQGTWTPAFVAGVNMGTGITNFSNSWSRIGNTVSLFINLASSDATGNSAEADQLQISGLPYPIDDALNQSLPSLFAQSAGRTNNSQWWGSVYLETSPEETRMTFRCFNVVGTVARDVSIRGIIQYLTDDTTWTPQNGAAVS